MGVDFAAYPGATFAPQAVAKSVSVFLALPRV